MGAGTAEHNLTRLAKTTRPEIAGALRREHLFGLLDGGPMRKVAWISGPAGSGKSTLAASYLDARDDQAAWYQLDSDDTDLGTFFHYLGHALRQHLPAPLPTPPDAADLQAVASHARRCFRMLFGSGKPLALVLDGLDELEAHSPLEVVLREGLTQVPPGCCVLVTSRYAPPPALARLRLGGQLAAVTAQDLLLGTDEIVALADARGCPLPTAQARQLREATQGWAAAVVLCLEQERHGAELSALSAQTAPGSVFDYLAGEVFNRFEPALRSFLLSVACLPRMGARAAQTLSGNRQAEQWLLHLVHHDYFVRQVLGAGERVYQFHPLLREFLRRRARQEQPAAVAPAALQRAAEVLLQSGQEEDALALFVEIGQWPQVAALAARLADSLLAQGRGQTLLGWLQLLPAALVEADADLLQAWARCQLAGNPRAARLLFEKAYAAQAQQHDARGMWHSGCGVLQALLAELDHLPALDRWCERLLRLQERTPGLPPAPAAMLQALLLRQPGHALLQAGPGGAPQPGFEQALAALLQGDFARADGAMAALAAGSTEPTGATQAMLLAHVRALLDGQALAASTAPLPDAPRPGSPEACWLQLLQAGLCLQTGRSAQAQSLLQALEAPALRRGERAALHYLRAGVAAAGGEHAQAQRELRSAQTLSVECGLPWIEWLVRAAQAQLLDTAPDSTDAQAQADACAALAVQLASPLLQCASWLLQAALQPQGSASADALSALGTGLGLARALGLRHIPGLQPGRLAVLCAQALQSGIEPATARFLVRAAGLQAPASAAHLADWPWPYRIRLLGGLEIWRGDTVVAFSAKGPGRPVELLKVLLAQGGRAVRTDQLAEALWPQTEADYAHKSFNQTLHLLRKEIFGSNDALVLRDGRLRLADGQFWVDTWALEQRLTQLEAQLRQVQQGQADASLAGLADAALALYRGPFLPDEEEQPSFMAERERLRARLLHLLQRLGAHWEESGRAAAAVEAYLRCLAADPLWEAPYRSLMQCLQRSGEVAEAMAVYERLRATLATRQRRMPSAPTQAVYASLHGAGPGGGLQGR